MAKSSDSQGPPSKVQRNGKAAKPAGSPIRTLYLILYNFVSAILWATVLGRVALIIPTYGHTKVYPGTGEFAKWTQTLALVEILHAAVGLVRAPIFTTFMQVASRIVLVWAVADQFPTNAILQPAYSSMLIAWSVTEVVRYSYFAINLAYGSVPGFLTWLRYNLFFVLYPLGIGSECWMIWTSRVPASQIWDGWDLVAKGVLLLYVPGSYVLYTHMMKQRRKVMRAQKEAGKKAQ